MTYSLATRGAVYKIHDQAITPMNDQNKFYLEHQKQIDNEPFEKFEIEILKIII